MLRELLKSCLQVYIIEGPNHNEKSVWFCGFQLADGTVNQGMSLALLLATMYTATIIVPVNSLGK